MRDVGAHASVSLLAVSSACVLVVPSRGVYSGHCGFSGIDTPCGKCLAASCSKQLDACCSDDACGGVIKDVESCCAGSADTCATLQNGSDANGAHRELSACVESQCKGACAASSAA